MEVKHLIIKISTYLDWVFGWVVILFHQFYTNEDVNLFELRKSQGTFIAIMIYVSLKIVFLINAEFRKIEQEKKKDELYKRFEESLDKLKEEEELKNKDLQWNGTGYYRSGQ